MMAVQAASLSEASSLAAIAALAELKAELTGMPLFCPPRLAAQMGSDNAICLLAHLGAPLRDEQYSWWSDPSLGPAPGVRDLWL